MIREIKKPGIWEIPGLVKLSIFLQMIPDCYMFLITKFSTRLFFSSLQSAQPNLKSTARAQLAQHPAHAGSPE
jgi:hypothetical protein